jgi:TorA maturation chaperone TorD
MTVPVMDVAAGTVVEPGVVGALQRLGRLFLEMPSEPGAQEAAREYVRLFCSPQGVLCPPWQSVYEPGPEDGGVPRLMGASHHQALQWFRRYGFEPVLQNEPADHVGLLLLFYAHLLDRDDVREPELAAFERAHLTWIPQFAAALRSASAAEPYRGAADALCELFPPLDDSGH